jgi:hypothetical protein
MRLVIPDDDLGAPGPHAPIEPRGRRERTEAAVQVAFNGAIVECNRAIVGLIHVQFHAPPSPTRKPSIRIAWRASVEHSSGPGLPSGRSGTPPGVAQPTRAPSPEAKEAAETDVAEVEQTEDWSSIAELPEWKQLCIKSYYACKDRGWTGKCDDCLRYCEGQQEWPTSRCGPRKKRK